MTDHPPLAHWYHVYADGNWTPMVHEHCAALTRFGLGAELDGFYVGMVGTGENCAAVAATLDQLAPGWTWAGQAETGWEQVTLNPLYEWVQTHDGLILYAHTKGASRNDPIDTPWRRAMTYHCVVEWRRPVEALMNGAAIAGCYWHKGGPSPIEGYGDGGMFGGNFWWTRNELLRHNVPPGQETRHHAEHWLGQMSEGTTPLTRETIVDLNPSQIGAGAPDWL